jgi:hypothetical protein
MLDIEPRSTRSRVFDAMLAGLAGDLALHHGLKVPHSALNPERSVDDKWWFATDTPSLKCNAPPPKELGRQNLSIRRCELVFAL